MTHDYRLYIKRKERASAKSDAAIPAEAPLTFRDGKEIENVDGEDTMGHAWATLVSFHVYTLARADSPNIMKVC